MFTKPKEPTDHHYSLDLVEEEMVALLKALDGKPPGKTMKERLQMRLNDAPRHDGPPLPPATLDWGKAMQEAKQRGSSIIDYIFDKARGKDSE